MLLHMLLVSGKCTMATTKTQSSASGHVSHSRIQAAGDKLVAVFIKEATAGRPDEASTGMLRSD